MSNRRGGRDLMYRWLVPWVVFPLAERLGGRRMWTETCRLKALQWRPQSELEARALERLRGLLMHAAAHVPHYRDLFRRVGMEPEDIRTLSDLSHLPITTKADLRAGFPARTTAHNLPEHRRQKMLTSGSTSPSIGGRRCSRPAPRGCRTSFTGTARAQGPCAAPPSSSTSGLAP